MSHRLGFLFSALAGSAFAVPALAQPPIRTVDPTTGHTYELSQTAELWDVANTQAQALSVSGIQGHFATISSQAENDFILNFWTPFTNTVWIGLTDFDTPTQYHWANNEPLVYTNWSINEPNNSQGLEHYTQMFQSTGKWNDLPNSRLNSIIEFDTLLPTPPDVPEPGTLALAASLLTFGTAFARRRRR